MEGLVRYLESVTTHFSRGQPVKVDRMENMIIKMKKMSKHLQGYRNTLKDSLITTVRLHASNYKTLWGIIYMC